MTRSKIARSHPPEDVIKKDIIDGKERGADKARSNSFLAIVQESVHYPDIGAGGQRCMCKSAAFCFEKEKQPNRFRVHLESIA